MNRAPWPRRGGPGTWSALALAVLAGLAQAASIASPLNGAPLWWLQVLSLAGLVALLEQAPSARAAGLRAWVFATAWLCGTFWWLYISMYTYGGLPAPLAALAVLGLAAFLSTYYGVAGAVYRALPARGLARRALAFGGLWLVAELLRSSWFTGFPWGAGGYAHVDGAAPWLAPLVGVYGLGALAAGLSAAIACALLARRLVPAAVAVLALCLGSYWPQGERAAASTPPLSVALLQGNIPQDEKFQAGSGVPTALAWYREQMESATESLIVAPETAIPVLPQELPPGYADELGKRFASGQQAALFGIPLGNSSQGYSNATLGLKPGQASTYVYDKHHLVPFGEFVPLMFHWFTEMMDIPLGDFRRGDVGQPSFVWQGERLAPNICYEDLFGDELARRFTDPAQAPTIFVNVSNIGWFGNTIAIDQHLNISRMRALEFRRPMVRATNTGATVVIDDGGRVTASLEPFTRAVLHTQVQGRSDAPTPYARWAGRWGHAPLWVLGLAVAWLAGAWRVRRRS
ncbi:apolipoprotein N-acyltransferase [Xylophilus rhododendri]|uniref:Apolipoprotein N-acyltransferase n=1 Tax=Xylophilus rhododendri TaxID=2697032 RepID=A0A857J989_9BURK|nr:apolipoprotein N-acyltransferase [Xylophilus rhododendri]QHI99562.1 apolipoprotein N-acyltransferase [Xylophilus rhododendri]